MKKIKKSLCIVLCVIISSMTFLAEFSYAADSVVYYDFDAGVLYVSGSGHMTSVYSDNNSIEEVYIERGITSVPAEAFSGCANLRKVTMSNSVKTIGVEAFKDCTSLSEIKLSDNIDVIPEFLFSGCTSLEGITLPDNAESVEYRAFYNCTGLRFVIVPNNVSYFDSAAFYGCSSLNDIYYAGNADEWEKVEFFSTGHENMLFLAPEFYIEKTYSSGKMILSLILESGSFNALDVQLAPHGDCSIYRIQPNRSFTSSNNKDNGMISMLSDEYPEQGDEIVKVTYNVADCENYSVAISFLCCTVTVEGIDVDVPLEYKNCIIQGSHSTSEWQITAEPSADGDGTAEILCDCCGGVVKNLPYAFKNCTVENGIACISLYGLNVDEFRSEYLTSDLPSVISFGNYIGTDTAVIADYSDGIVYNYSVLLKGDIDGDGFCDAQDSILMACVCEEMLFEDDFSQNAVMAMKCNNDSVIDYYDVQFAEFNGIQKLNLS